MDKKIICVSLVLVVLSSALVSCSLNVNQGGAQLEQPTFMSYSEKASYYDSLVAGDSDPIPLTTALNSSITIQGDKALLDEEVYEKIVDIANQTYSLIRSKYGTSGSTAVTIMLDAASNNSPCYAVGNTILLNTEWFNSHPNECDMLVEGFASFFLNYDHKERFPEWISNALRYYIRDEFGLYQSESTFRLPKRYNGKSYESDGMSAAAFLKWIKQTYQVDIADRLNRQIRAVNGFDEVVWINSTGKTLDQLWTAYKSA